MEPLSVFTPTRLVAIVHWLAHKGDVEPACPGQAPLPRGGEGSFVAHERRAGMRTPARRSPLLLGDRLCSAGAAAACARRRPAPQEARGRPVARNWGRMNGAEGGRRGGSRLRKPWGWEPGTG